MTYARQTDEDRYNDETDAEREMSQPRRPAYTAVVTSLTNPRLETVRRGPFDSATAAADWARDAFPQRPVTILVSGHWCTTHAETVSRDGLVQATRVDPWGRPQCDDCYGWGVALRGALD